MTPLAAATMDTARGELGVCEQPLGSNSGPRVQFYQDYVGKWVEGQSWCCAFALWCIAHAAHTLGTESAIPKTASSSALYHWLRDNGKLLAKPEPGCIALVQGGPTGHEHTCLVESVDWTKRIVHTIDGNWGNKVQRVMHPLDGCDYGEIC